MAGCDTARLECYKTLRKENHFGRGWAGACPQSQSRIWISYERYHAYAGVRVQVFVKSKNRDKMGEARWYRLQSQAESCRRE